MALAAALARTCGGLRAARRVLPAPRLPRAAAACTTSSDLSPGPAVRRPDTCAGSLPLARRVYSTGAKGGASWALGPHGRFTHIVRSASTARRKHRVKSASSAHSDGSMLLLPSVHGVDVTCASPAAVDLYDEAVSDYLALRGDPVTKLQKAVVLDSDFTMGHVALGLLHLLSTGHTTDTPAVANAVVEAVRLREAGLCTPRERAFVTTLQLWASQHLRAAAAQLEGLLLEVPRDGLAVRCLHDTYFFLGDKANLLNAVARVFPAWDFQMLSYGRVAGMLAFAMQESRLFAAAQEAAATALDMDPTDVWALHAMAHIHETNCQYEEGLDMMADLEGSWGEAELLKCHMHWHTGLLFLGLGDVDAALARYDAGVREDASTLVLDLCDAASLLWRIELKGGDVGARWHDLAKLWEPYARQHITAFNDVHIAMTYAAAGDVDALTAHTESRVAFAARASHPRRVGTDLATTGVPAAAFSKLRPVSAAAAGTDTQDTRVVLASVGNTVCDGMIAYQLDDYETCVSCLFDARLYLQDIGGSDAQRDVVEQTLIQAALTCADNGGAGAARYRRLAAVLLRERMALRAQDEEARSMYDTLLSDAAEAGDPLPC